MSADPWEDTDRYRDITSLGRLLDKNRDTIRKYIYLRGIKGFQRGHLTVYRVSLVAQAVYGRRARMDR